MNLGLVAALVGVLCIGVGNTAMKYLANRYSNQYTGLLLQYISMAICALVYVIAISSLMGEAIFPSLTLSSRGILPIVGIVGYAGIVFLFKAFATLSSGVALIIANLSLFLSYFANIYLFDTSESLPLVQLMLAVVFFVVVAQFLWTKSTVGTGINTALDTGLDTALDKPNWNIIYPLVTAVCWSVFFVGNTRFVKNHVMTPVQSVFATETMILVVALVHYAVLFKADFSDLSQSFRTADCIPLAIVGLCNIGGNFLFYYGYLDNPANIINFIRLFTIIAAAVLSWFFLKDYMTKKQIILMSVAFLILIMFIFADEVLLLS